MANEEVTEVKHKCLPVNRGKHYDPPGYDLTGADSGATYRIVDRHSDVPWLCKKHLDGQWVSWMRLDAEGIAKLLGAVVAGICLSTAGGQR